LALHFGLAAGLGHEIGAGKIQLGGSAAMLVVHRLNASTDTGDAEGRSVLHGLDDHGGLRVSLSKRAQTQGESGSQQKFSLQSILLNGRCLPFSRLPVAGLGPRAGINRHSESAQPFPTCIPEREWKSPKTFS